MEKITHEQTDADANLEKVIGRLRSRIEYSDLDTIAKVGLHKFLEEIVADIFNFSDSLIKTIHCKS